MADEVFIHFREHPDGSLSIEAGGVLPPDGVPCSHRGCLSHISHPCEGCGRIGGRRVRSRPEPTEGTQEGTRG